MTIQQLQALNMSLVQPEALQKAVQEIINDYKETSNKKAFEEIAKENIEKVFLLVERIAPKAIVKKEKPQAKINQYTKEKTPKKEALKKELDGLNKDIKACRLKIKKFNEEKRKNEPKKPKPTRHAKIKSHFISIINLVPPQLKENIAVQKEAEKVLLKAHRGIMNAYKMNTIRAKKGEEAIKDKFDQLEEKATK